MGHGLDIHSTWAVLGAGGIEKDATVRTLIAAGGIAVFVLYKVVLFIPLCFIKIRWWQAPLIAWGTAMTFGVVFGNYAVLERLS